MSLQGITLLGMYLLGVVVAGIVSFILKLTILKGDPALFLMEMPPLRIPSLRTVYFDVYDRVRSFIKNAGTMILACSVVLWFLASFPKPPENYSELPVRYSIAGRLGGALEPLIKPLGFNWEIGVSLIASFAAREVFISSLATIYQLESDEDQGSLINALKVRNENGTFSTKTAVSLMVFYVFACQCMSTLAVTRRETGSWGWVGLMFGYMTVLAWGMSYLFYNFIL
jgi:ferrous iron transport protein B